MAAPVWQSKTDLAGASGTTISVPVPASVASGDIIVVGIYAESTIGTLPTGFTLKTSVTCTTSGQGHTSYIYWKRATGADSGTYAFTQASNVWRTAWAWRVTGCLASGDPFGATANTADSAAAAASTSTPAVATLTPSVDNCLVLFSGTCFNPVSYTAPSGFTERTDTGDSITSDSLSQTTATATGSVTATINSSQQGKTGIVAYLLPVSSTFAAAGTTAATTTVSGDASRLAPAAGTAVATTTVTGDAARIPPPLVAAGTSVATTAVTGNVTIAHYGVSGTAVATTTATGTATNVRYAVSGTVAATTAVTGAVTARMLATGTAAATTTAVGTVGKRFGPANGAAGVVNAVTSASGSILVAGKPGQGDEVLALFDPDEVLTSGRVTYYQFDLLDEDENLVGTLQGVDSGDIAIDAYASVKGTGTLTVYTDPQFSHLADGQPDFLGVQVNTPLGPSATAFSTSATPDILTCAAADATDINIGDLVILVDPTSHAPKESTVFTVTAKGTAFGFTNINYTPDSATLVQAGDEMLTVTVGFTQTVDWLNVRIRPMIRIARLGGGDDPQGTLVPAGVFLCAAPVEEWTATGLKRQVELTDKLSILDQDIASGDPTTITSYSAAAGANVITLVQTIIGETGELYPAIQPDTKTLASPLVWDIGTTRLKIINDLLDAGGYFSLWCDGWGQYQATPYVQPSDRVPVYQSIAPFSDGPQSLMAPEWTRDRDIYSIPNRFLVVGQGDGTTAALTSLATNVDDTSPYSFNNRGRWITSVEVGVEAVDQAALDTIARARLSSATSVTNQITVPHIFLPDLHINSVVHFVNPDSGLDIFCYVVKTTIPLDPIKLCQTVMRLVS